MRRLFLELSSVTDGGGCPRSAEAQVWGRSSRCASPRTSLLLWMRPLMPLSLRIRCFRKPLRFYRNPSQRQPIGMAGPVGLINTVLEVRGAVTWQVSPRQVRRAVVGRPVSPVRLFASHFWAIPRSAAAAKRIDSLAMWWPVLGGRYLSGRPPRAPVRIQPWTEVAV